MKKHKLFFRSLIPFLFILVLTPLFGTSFQGDQNITITSEVYENLYLAGGNVLIDAPIRGDLICAAGDVTIQDTITKDVLLCGGTLKIMGFIGDDLRVVGGTITITNIVNGDLIVAGGDVTISKDARINGNLYMAGGKLTVNGTVKGLVNLGGGEIFWNGNAEKEVIVKGGNFTFNGNIQGKSQIAAQKINLGEQAKFYADVEYWNAAGELDFGNTLLNGATSSYNEALRITDEDINWRYLGIGLIAFWIYRLLTAALIIALLIWMFHRFFYRHSDETHLNIASHLGYGFIYLIGVPVLIVLAFATVIGIPIGLILMMLYGITIALGAILASILIAYGLNYYYEKNWNRWMLFLVSIGVYLVLKLLALIPLLGFLASFIIVTTAFGTIIYILWKNRKANIPPVVGQTTV